MNGADYEAVLRDTFASEGFDGLRRLLGGTENAEEYLNTGTGSKAARLTGGGPFDGRILRMDRLYPEIRTGAGITYRRGTLSSVEQSYAEYRYVDEQATETAT